MDDDRSFGRLVFGRTISESLKVFKSRRNDVSFAALSLAIGLVVRVHSEGWKTAMTDFGPTLETSAVVFAIFLISVIIWNLWLAPAALAYEVAKASGFRGVPDVQVPQVLEQPKPNWMIWRQRAEYEVWELASLLSKIDPNKGRDTADKIAIKELILEELRSQKLQFRQEYITAQYTGERYPQKISINTKIARGDAIQWAKSKGIDVSELE